MRSRTDPVASIALALALTACAGPAMTPSDPPASLSGAAAATRAAETSTAASPSASTTPSSTATMGIALATPGTPFDGDTLLEEMRASRRPGGVPEAVQTRAVADALAATLWTADGSAWETTAIGGFCGPEVCTLDVAGMRIDHAGDDLWVLEVRPETADVQVVSAELRSLPFEMVDALDALARDLDSDGSLDPMILSTARWLPPPDEGLFVLSYRSGGEEGSCGWEVTLDAGRGVVIETVSTDC